MLLSPGSKIQRGQRITAAQAATLAGVLPAGSLERGERLTPMIVDDFFNGTSAHTGFVFTAIASGTLAGSATGVATSHHPGCVTITSSTTTNSGAVVQANASAFLIGGGEQYDCVLKTDASFANNTMRLGLHDTTSSVDAVDGAYFEVSATGVVTAKTSNNSVRTTSATIITMAVNTWYHCRVKVNPTASAVDFTVYSDAGAVLGTTQITANIPTVSGRECAPQFVATNVGTVATVLVHIDYMAFGYQGRTLIRGALT